MSAGTNHSISPEKFITRGARKIPLVKNVRRIPITDESQLLRILNGDKSKAEFYLTRSKILKANTKWCSKISEPKKAKNSAIGCHTTDNQYRHFEFDEQGLHDIHYFAMDNQVDHRFVQILSKYVNVPTQDGLMRSPLHVAILSKSSAETVRILLARGADVLQCDTEYRNALHYCVETGDHRIFETLIRHIFGEEEEEESPKRNVFIRNVLTAVDVEGNTLLMKCIFKRNIKILNIILNAVPPSMRSSIVNRRNSCNGKTALCMIGELDMDETTGAPRFSNASRICAHLLLANEADPYVENLMGLNAFEFARRLRNKAFHEYLKHHPFLSVVRT